MTTLQNSPWTRVEDDLPIEGTPVLVYIPAWHCQTTAYLNYDHPPYFWLDGDADDLELANLPSHWQSLPPNPAVIIETSKKYALDVDGWKSHPLDVDPQKWNRHVINPGSPTDVDSITETVEAVLKFIDAYGPESLSLKNITNAPFQVEHLAAVLRLSSTWSYRVPGWNDALREAKRFFEPPTALSNGYSVSTVNEDILFGLNPIPGVHPSITPSSSSRLS